MKTSVRLSIVAVLALAILGALALKPGRPPAPSKVTALAAEAIVPGEASQAQNADAAAHKLPRLVDLGAGKCIPCKLMAPILADLRRDYADRFTTEFIDVWENPDAGKRYGIEVIPTQIFYDAAGKERFRHTGFYGKEDILGKWQELGVPVSGNQPPGLIRETALQPDRRPRDQVCFLCDGDVAPKARTVVKGQSEERILCSPHCYFIYYSSLVGADPTREEGKVRVTDAATGNLVAAVDATYLYGLDARGRATILAFADRAVARLEQQKSPGNLLPWEILRAKELTTRCAFCDRAVYPEDACGVMIGATRGYGCCTHCALGVAARLHLDIDVQAKDGLTGEPIRVRTLDGQVASLEPKTAVAWFGQNRTADGKWVSAGCFKQGFFGTPENLQKWLEARPAMTGRQISIAQALADKMKLSPEQIAKACKLGECQ